MWPGGTATAVLGAVMVLALAGCSVGFPVPRAPLPVVTIAADADAVVPGDRVTFTVTALPAPTERLEVGVQVTGIGDGPWTTIVTIAAGWTEATFSVPFDQSSGVTVNVELMAGSGSTIGSERSASVTVLAGDGSSPSDPPQETSNPPDDDDTGGDHVIEGGAGDDSLRGGPDDDRLTGGEGDDTFVFGLDNGDDVITDFSRGRNVIDLRAFSTIGDFPDLTLIADSRGVIVDLSDHVGGTILVESAALDDLDVGDFLLYGWVYGFDDEFGDTLHGTAGDDSIAGRGGGDTIHGRGGNDHIRGDEGGDALYGEAGDDLLDGGTGKDNLLGGADADTIEGGAGGDCAWGGTGDDTIRGGTGDDTIHGDEGGDALYGEAGDDLLLGDKGDDTLHGGSGSDEVYGNGDDDVLFGGEGNDTVSGGDGSDTLDGGRGDDYLDGDILTRVIRGRVFEFDTFPDTFVFAHGDFGDDIIREFGDGEDVIDLSAFAIGGFDDLTISAHANGALIDLTEHGGGTIQLQNFGTGSLDAEDFVFRGQG